MIKIELRKNQLRASGHATSSKLICNSVSVLMWSLGISLGNADAKELVIVEGEGFESVSFKPDEKTKQIFAGTVKSLELMAGQYPKEIKFVRRKI